MPFVSRWKILGVLVWPTGCMRLTTPCVHCDGGHSTVASFEFAPRQNESPGLWPGLSDPVCTGISREHKLASRSFDCGAATGVSSQPVVALHAQSPGVIPGGVTSMRNLPVSRLQSLSRVPPSIAPTGAGAPRPRGHGKYSAHCARLSIRRLVSPNPKDHCVSRRRNMYTVPLISVPSDFLPMATPCKSRGFYFLMLNTVP